MNPSTPKRKVLLIGWDAADWKIMTPLMEQGLMPNLARLVERGVMGNLATLHPVLSPMLWTSIATGKRPFKHGILGFTEPTPDGGAVQPVSQLSRTTKAIWNILNQSGYRSGVVGWWPSHPVEEINGAMVSNHYHHAVGPPDQPWPMPSGTVHPERVSEALAELRFNPNELVPEEVLPFVPKALEIDQEKDRRLASVMKILAECISMNNAATWLMQNEPWDFFAVYFDAIDHFCHAFMRYHPPRQDWIGERDFELYSGVVNAGYRFHDMMLGTQLALVDEETTVIMCSDHGFHPDHMRPRQIPREPAGPAVEHRDLGMLVIAGPGIRKDELVHGATLLDVTPTILTLLGLPVGDDMDGKPLLQAFENPPEVTRVPSWDAIPGDDGRHSPAVRQDPLAAKAALDQLVALGYVEAQGEDQADAVSRCVAEMRYNLARSYMDADLYPQAIPILAELGEAHPEEIRYGTQLALCLRAVGDTPALRVLVEKMRETRSSMARRADERLAQLRDTLQERRAARRSEKEARAAAADAGQGPADAQEGRLLSAKEREELDHWRYVRNTTSYDLEFLMSCVLLDEGNPQEALACLARAGEAHPDRPGLHIQVGEAYLKLRKLREAEESYRKALAIDPLNFHAHLGLARSCLRQRRYEEAAAQALETVRLMFHYPMAHFVLGNALFRLRRIDAAERSLNVALELNPNFIEAHRMLMSLYRFWKPDPAALRKHRKAVAELRRLGRKGREAGIAAMAAEFAEAPTGEHDEAGLEPAMAPPAAPEAAGGVDRLPGEDAPADFVAVVAGLPRSGTSMLMQMLDAGGMRIFTDSKRKADEDNPKGYFETEKATQLRKNRDWVREATNMGVKIVAQLLPYLPQEVPVRVVFIERDLDEVLASQKTMLERMRRPDGKFADGQIRAAFTRQLTIVKRWLARNPNAWVLYVQHREIVRDPRAAATAINGFLGGRLDVEAMVRAVDPSLYRQRAQSDSRGDLAVPT